MKSFSSLVGCLVLALSVTACWVPALPDDTIFSCETNDDCAATGVVCAPRADQRGYCCAPTAEVCNGADDNCNGVRDDLDTSPCYSGPEGTEGVGNCVAGKNACDSKGGLTCAGQVQPTAELCNGQDDDCDGQSDEDFDLLTDMKNCGACGTVCNAARDLCVEGQCVLRKELNCSDGKDNDQDGFIDCADSDCDTQTCGEGRLCLSRSCGEGACTDGVDNDGDGQTDCADKDCDQKACGTGAGCICTGTVAKEVDCSDGQDNDKDGNVDCKDSDCTACGTGCICTGGNPVELGCGDGLDNDKDGKTDCEDSDCTNKECGSNASCVCSGGVKVEKACSDGADNDGDGLIDCKDSDCTTCGTGCACSGGNPLENLCADGVDNDRDTLIDCKDADCENKSCNTAGGCTCVSGNKTEVTCNDNKDNDGDGKSDCADTDCNNKTCASGKTCKSGACS